MLTLDQERLPPTLSAPGDDERAGSDYDGDAA